MMNSILELLKLKEAFHSCQIEGIVPSNWTFIDYYNFKIKEKMKSERQKQKSRKKVMQKDEKIFETLAKI